MAMTQRIASRCEIFDEVLFFSSVLAFYLTMCWGKTILNLHSSI